MSEMIERMAREIEIAVVEKTAHHPVSRFIPGLKWLWPIIARAVLTAMREPTDEMWEALERWWEPAGLNEIPANLDSWQAMIDAALNE